jgi:hypothetical protein
MSRTVWIAENVYDPSTWEKFEGVSSVNELLLQRYTAKPANMKIYWKYVAASCDVTPQGTPENIDAMAERLDRLDGIFFVMNYPAEPVTIIAIIAIVLAVAAIAAVFLFRPSQKPDNSASPNNSLTDRQNTARPNERIPDIFGEVRSVPDVIAPPFRVFESNQEVEYGGYCIGRGSYALSQVSAVVGGSIVWDIKDDTTPLQQMDGSSAKVYGPGTSPNSGDAPLLLIGPTFDQPFINVTKSASVIGQILRAPNDTSVGGSGVGGIFVAHSDGTISCSDSNTDFTAYFGIGDDINFYNGGAGCNDPAGIQPPVNLDGNYVAAAVTSSILTFVNPSAVNAAWGALASFGGEQTTAMAPRITASGSRVIGPYVMDVTDCTEIWCNIVAPNGLFKVSSSSGNQYRIDTAATVTITPLDENFNPVGTSRSFSGAVIGSAVIQSQRAITIKCVLPLRTDGKPAGRVQVTCVRTTSYDTSWLGTNADVIQWRDLMAISPVTKQDFGNVTIMQTKSYATASALVATQRKLNVEVTRKLPVLDPVTHLAVAPFAFNCDVASVVVAHPDNFMVALTFTGNIAGPAPTGTIGFFTTQYGIDSSTSTVATGPFAFNTMIGFSVGAAIGPITLNYVYSGDANYPSSRIIIDCSVETDGTAVIPVPFSKSKVSDTNMVATRNAADIAIALALDPYLGNRPLTEIDFTNINSTLGVGQAVSTYFGSDLCCEFCYTFDDTQTTFEEMMTIIAQATFCTPYRRGSLLSMYFEKLTQSGTILFNHRNKLPGTETRTVTFGLNSNYDGIELNYIDPAAPNYPQVETTVTLYYPTNQSATNPKQITLQGVRNNVQAALVGWRLYNKLLYQNTAVEFQSTGEAAIVISTQRILVADNTRPDVQDGEITAQTGLTLTTSQPVVFAPGKDYAIFLQMYDGSIDNIAITPGPTANQVVLAGTPALPLVMDDDRYAKTTYQVAGPPINKYEPIDVDEVGIAWDGTFGIISDRALDGLTFAGNKIKLIGVIAEDQAGIQTSVDLSGTYTIDHVDHLGTLGEGNDDIFISGVDWSFLNVFAPTTTSTRDGAFIVNPGNPAAPITAYLLQSKEANDGSTYKLQALNYDDRYYGNDKDFINGTLLLNDISVSNAPFPDGGGYY